MTELPELGGVGVQIGADPFSVVAGPLSRDGEAAGLDRRVRSRRDPPIGPRMVVDVDRTPARQALDRGATVADDDVHVGHRLGDVERRTAVPSELAPLQVGVRPRRANRRRTADRRRVVVPEQQNPDRPLGEPSAGGECAEIDGLAQADDLAGSDARRGPRRLTI